MLGRELDVRGGRHVAGKQPLKPLQQPAASLSDTARQPDTGAGLGPGEVAGDMASTLVDKAVTNGSKLMEGLPLDSITGGGMLKAGGGHTAAGVLTSRTQAGEMAAAPAGAGYGNNTGTAPLPPQEVLSAQQDNKPVYGIPQYPATMAFRPPEGLDQVIPNPGMPRANKAISRERPDGDPRSPADRTVLQQHVMFWDRDNDGVIYPIDTFVGFRRLGFNLLISTLAVPFIHLSFSYPTLKGWLPDPRLPIYLDQIHRTKHGSDSEVYDTEGRFVPEKFEEIFSKFDKDNKGGLGWTDIQQMVYNNMNINDPNGWVAERLEWWVTYLLLRDHKGLVSKEKIRAVYDGTIWETVAAEVEARKNRRSAYKYEIATSPEPATEIALAEMASSTAETRDQVALRAVKAEAKDVSAELQNVLAALVRNPDDVFLQNIRRRLEGAKEKIESRLQTLQSHIVGEGAGSTAPAVRALPPPAELTADFERRAQQHPLSAQQAQRGRGAATGPATNPANVPLLFNWRAESTSALLLSTASVASASSTAAARARNSSGAAAEAGSSSSSSSSSGAGAAAGAAEVAAAAAAAIAGGLLLPQLAHPVFAHVLRLLEGGAATAATAAADAAAGLTDDDLVAAAGLIEAACGYSQAVDEAHLAAAVQEVLLPYLFGPQGGAAAAGVGSAGYVRHATPLARQHHAASASASAPFSARAAPRWAVGDDPSHPAHLFLLAEFRTGLAATTSGSSSGSSGASSSPTADPAFVGAAHYMDFWQRRQQRQHQQQQAASAGGGSGADVWGLQTYRPAFLLEVLGPNVRLSALSWTDRPLVTPLTPLLPLLPLHDPQLLRLGPAAAGLSSDDRLLLPVARLLSGLRAGLRWLAALHNHASRHALAASSPQQPQVEVAAAATAAAAAAPAKRRRVKTTSPPTAAPVEAVAAAPPVPAPWAGSSSPSPALPYPILLSRRYAGHDGAAPAQALGPRTFLLSATAPDSLAAATSSTAASPASGPAPVAAAAAAGALLVVVKLARAYDLQAHREWAALGLAPPVMRTRRLRSGWVLVESQYLPREREAAAVGGGAAAWQSLVTVLASGVEADRVGALAAVKSALQRGSAGGGPAAAGAASRVADALGADITAAAGGWLVRRGGKAWEAQLVDFTLPDATSRRLLSLATARRRIAERKRALLQQHQQAAAAAAAAQNAAAEAAVASALAASEAAIAATAAATATAAGSGRKRAAGRQSGNRGTVSVAGRRSIRSREEAAAVANDGATPAAAAAPRHPLAAPAGEGKGGTTGGEPMAAVSGAASRGTRGSVAGSATSSSASSAGGATVKGRSRRGSPPPPAAMLAPAPPRAAASLSPAPRLHLLRARPLRAGPGAPQLGARLRVLGW
ncbi:hypothetical protein HYH02_007328 [Chlamydomonas schloesseri]|uniref:EF-hand domain-containing protein n=1 Tax=Chlamydomonas schloesseri TaxID=2026947 RepID=A0A835WI91_9CHLO|nr:hypothetical protein HYH02_007328 [Chlamydomonas schloesseri]|eukprot:KAG2447872.1 hypothetical protein HYH02_007328 [Chlamydomonas schloesseri]